MGTKYVVEAIKYCENGECQKTKLTFEVFQGKVYDVEELKT